MCNLTSHKIALRDGIATRVFKEKSTLHNCIYVCLASKWCYKLWICISIFNFKGNLASFPMVSIGGFFFIYDSKWTFLIPLIPIEHTEKVNVLKRNSPCINNHLRNLNCSPTIPSADIQIFLKNAEKQANLVENLTTRLLTAIKWLQTVLF